MTGIGENTLAQPVKPPLRERRACLAKLVKNRLTLTNGLVRSMSAKGCSPDNSACEGFFGRLKNEFFRYRDWEGVTAEEFMGRLEAYLVYYREERNKKSLGWLSPMGYRRKLGYAQARSKKSSAPPRFGKFRWRNRLKCDGEIGCFYSSTNSTPLRPPPPGRA